MGCKSDALSQRTHQNSKIQNQSNDREDDDRVKGYERPENVRSAVGVSSKVWFERAHRRLDI